MGENSHRERTVKIVRDQLSCGKCITWTIREEIQGREEREDKRERRFRIEMREEIMKKRKKGDKW